MNDFKDELISISIMLHSADEETRMLGYNLLRESNFKKFMRNKLWTLNNKSFYRFHLYALRQNSYSIGSRKYYLIDCSNYNKIGFADKVINYYLNNQLKIKKIKWQQ